MVNPANRRSVKGSGYIIPSSLVVCVVVDIADVAGADVERSSKDDEESHRRERWKELKA